MIPWALYIMYCIILGGVYLLTLPPADIPAPLVCCLGIIADAPLADGARRRCLRQGGADQVLAFPTVVRPSTIPIHGDWTTMHSFIFDRGDRTKGIFPIMHY